MKGTRSIVSGSWLTSAGCLLIASFACDAQAQDSATGGSSAKDAPAKSTTDQGAATKDSSSKDQSTKDAPAEEARAYDARAKEGWLMNGVFAVGTGIQGGDPGTGAVAWTRARTRLLAGIDLRSDEARADGVGFYGFAEIERRASFGAEVRYQRWWTSTIAFHAAILGTIVPESMIGGGVGARIGFPIANKVTLFLEPGFAVFPFGSDLPGNNIILWGTLIGGVGVAL